MATFITALATARHNHGVATTALSKAMVNITPVTPEHHELFMTRPERYAEMLHQVADIVATVPALHAAVAETAAVLEPLAARACHRCSGDGLYHGATNARRRGVPYCIYCNGTGESSRS